MKINWKLRIKSKKFWLTFIPAVLILGQLVSDWFGYDFAAEHIESELTKFVNSVFAVLVILGIVTDPTTSGIGDSKKAMTYSKPKKDGE